MDGNSATGTKTLFLQYLDANLWGVGVEVDQNHILTFPRSYVCGSVRRLFAVIRQRFPTHKVVCSDLALFLAERLDGWDRDGWENPSEMMEWVRANTVTDLM